MNNVGSNEVVNYVKKGIVKVKFMKKVLPVIHHLDEETTLSQAEIAYKCGADGVFLISHFNKDSELEPLALKIKNENWKTENGFFTVGLNLLSTPVMQSISVAKKLGVDYLWLDNAGISSLGMTDLSKKLVAEMVSCEKLEVFASVAFKYQKEDPNPSIAAIIAMDNGFIPTTSGTKTGSPPTIEKIKSMSQATNGFLAVASGMTVENIDNYSPYLSHILVSTGVSVGDYHFDTDLLTHFIHKVKNSSN